MADTTKNNRRWMRRGAKAWHYNGAWNASGVEPVTLAQKNGMWWQVMCGDRCWTADPSDLYRTKADALLALRDAMRRHCNTVEKRIAEIDEAIEQSKKEAGE